VVSGVATPLASLGTEVVKPQVQALGLGRAAGNLAEETGVSTSEALEMLTQTESMYSGRG
jgi:hypothetical protein